MIPMTMMTTRTRTIIRTMDASSNAVIRLLILLFTVSIASLCSLRFTILYADFIYGIHSELKAIVTI